MRRMLTTVRVLSKRKYGAAGLLALFYCAVVLLPSDAEARAHRHSRHHGIPWCGIYYSQYKGIHKRSLWVARNWAYEGVPASGPGIGVTVVWPHHVGEIVGKADDGGWIVHSGNDGGAIRTRERSLAGVIAYRRIGGGGYAMNSHARTETVRDAW